MSEVRTPFDQSFAVSYRGVGSNDHPGPGEVGTPAQIDVFAVERHRRIKTAERAEQIRPHEQARRRQHEHIAHGVVLLLVELTRIDHRIDFAEPVEAEPDVLQSARLIPIGQLRSDDSGVRTEHLFDHHPDHVRSESDIVVAQQEQPVVTFDQPQHLVGRRSVADICCQRSHERGRNDGANPVRDLLCLVVVTGGDEEQGSQIGVVLCGEAGEGLVEPVAWFVYDHHGYDRRRELGVGLHDAPRLVPEPALRAAL